MFADDVVLLNDTKEKAEQELEQWREALENRGMRLSRTKTEYMCVGQRSTKPAILMQGEVVPETCEFKYLGSTIQKHGDCGTEVKRRTQAGWNSWRKVTGVMCDRRMPNELKGNVYKAVVRPAMMYGMETVPLTKKQERELEVTEMRMLRWTLGLTKLDRERNENVRERLGVEEISRKIRESRLRWFGHVERRDTEYVGKRVLEMEIAGKRKRGRPKRRWMDCIEKDMSEVGLEVEDVLDRKLWRNGIYCGYPASSGTG